VNRGYGNRRVALLPCGTRDVRVFTFNASTNPVTQTIFGPLFSHRAAQSMTDAFIYDAVRTARGKGKKDGPASGDADPFVATASGRCATARSRYFQVDDVVLLRHARWANRC